MRLLILLVAASLAKADKLPAGSSYLPPTAASNGYGAPQASYGGANDDYYDDYEEDQQPSYSEDQVGHLAKRVLDQYQNGPIFLKNIALLLWSRCNSVSRFFSKMHFELYKV